MKKEASFMDMLDKRMSDEASGPAEQPMQEQSPTPVMDEAMAEVEEPEQEEGVSMPELYELVFGEDYDPADPLSEGKMEQMSQAMEQDPRVKEMALNEPEKFALFMYGRSSRMA
jgi:hypothetical protein